MAEWRQGGVTLIAGDCLSVMAGMEAESVDAVVTDPPYGIGFMGKEWDSEFIAERVKRKARKDTEIPPGHGRIESGGFIEYDRSLDGNRAFQEWCYRWALAAFRVLKPGAHMLVFGGTRTHHRLWCAVEDAGFEVRDCLMWLYGSGFPKSLDVSKAIDKAAGAEREKVQPGNPPAYQRRIGNTRPWMDDPDHKIDGPEPITDAARRWQGWGTALKPAWEPILLARKPLSGTVAENVQAHGTGALNVDGCRVKGRVRPAAGKPSFGPDPREQADAIRILAGRWPPNVVLDEDAAERLDAQSGESESKPHKGAQLSGSGTHEGWRRAAHRKDYPKWSPHNDSGGASRFMYVAKASRAERGNGNNHPTVKPLALMKWLVTLITPPGGLVLDPFLGSGTTALACQELGFRCVGVELNPEYVEIAKQRLMKPRQMRLGQEVLND